MECRFESAGTNWGIRYSFEKISDQQGVIPFLVKCDPAARNSFDQCSNIDSILFGFAEIVVRKPSLIRIGSTAHPT
jgi:hypothetical protein